MKRYVLANSKPLYKGQYRRHEINERFIPRYAQYMYTIVGCPNTYFTSLESARQYIDEMAGKNMEE